MSPDLYRITVFVDPSLTGSWEITATRESESASPILTPPIAAAQEVPFVKNLRVVGGGLTPQVSWELPDLAGFDIDRIRIVVIVDRTIPMAMGVYDEIFVSKDLAPNSTTFTTPAGVLKFGRTYVFRVMLEDLEGTVLENRSSSFTKPFSPVL